MARCTHVHVYRYIYIYTWRKPKGCGLQLCSSGNIILGCCIVGYHVWVAEQALPILPNEVSRSEVNTSSILFQKMFTDTKRTRTCQHPIVAFLTPPTYHWGSEDPRLLLSSTLILIHKSLIHRFPKFPPWKIAVGSGDRRKTRRTTRLQRQPSNMERINKPSDNKNG